MVDKVSRDMLSMRTVLESDETSAKKRNSSNEQLMITVQERLSCLIADLCSYEMLEYGASILSELKCFRFKFSSYLLARLMSAKSLRPNAVTDNKAAPDTFCRQRKSAKVSPVDATTLSYSSTPRRNSNGVCDSSPQETVSIIAPPLHTRQERDTIDKAVLLPSKNSKDLTTKPQREFSCHVLRNKQTFNLNKLRSACTNVPQRRQHLGLSVHLSANDSSTLLHVFTLLCFILLTSTTRVDAAWWSPGSGSSLVNTSRICQWARQVGGPQLDMCRKELPVVEQIRRGIELGVEACQNEMKNHRWNCTQAVRPFYARVMNQDTRETALVQALTAAAITYQVTSACWRGLIDECGCANNRRLKDRLLRLEAAKRNITVNEEKLKAAVDNFEWGGCGDNVEYGIMKSQEFLSVSRSSNRREKGTAKAKVKIYNENAGRMAIKNYREKSCNCHGLSGSCTMWTCWKIIPPFSEVSFRLRTKYKYAVRVVGGNDGKTLRPIRRRYTKRRKGALKRRTRSAMRRRPSKRKFKSRYTSSKRPHNFRGSRRRYPRPKRTSLVDQRLSGEELIYMQKSSSFCSFSKKQGSFGTKGRLCEANKRGIGSCRYLCCGRGYNTVHVVETKSCNCRFQFCCKVNCDSCIENNTLHYCR